jgi:hypothetical protein
MGGATGQFIQVLPNNAKALEFNLFANSLFILVQKALF